MSMRFEEVETLIESLLQNAESCPKEHIIKAAAELRILNKNVLDLAYELQCVVDYWDEGHLLTESMMDDAKTVIERTTGEKA